MILGDPGRGNGGQNRRRGEGLEGANPRLEVLSVRLEQIFVLWKGEKQGQMSAHATDIISCIMKTLRIDRCRNKQARRKPHAQNRWN